MGYLSCIVRDLELVRGLAYSVGQLILRMVAANFTHGQLTTRNLFLRYDVMESETPEAILNAMDFSLSSADVAYPELDAITFLTSLSQEYDLMHDFPQVYPIFKDTLTNVLLQIRGSQFEAVDVLESLLPTMKTQYAPFQGKFSKLDEAQVQAEGDSEFPSPQSTRPMMTATTHSSDKANRTSGSSTAFPQTPRSRSARRTLGPNQRVPKQILSQDEPEEKESPEEATNEGGEEDLDEEEENQEEEEEEEPQEEDDEEEEENRGTHTKHVTFGHMPKKITMSELLKQQRSLY